jgi:hypothetical protein
VEEFGADFIVNIYNGRWVIEELNKALKSSCSLLERQAQRRRVMENVIALMLPVAHKILRAKWLYHIAPDEMAMNYFDEKEFKVLVAMGKLKTVVNTKGAQVVEVIASLGGVIKRKNRHPGWQSIGDGYPSLHTILQGLDLRDKLEG